MALSQWFSNTLVFLLGRGYGNNSIDRTWSHKMALSQATKRRVAAWKRAFLKSLATDPNVCAAARAAGVTQSNVYLAKKKDPKFEAAWKEAEQLGVATLEVALHTRAVTGVTKGVWHQGERVGEEQQYSDTAAIFLLKAHKPDRYRENLKVEHAGRVDHEHVVTYTLPDNGRDKK